MMSWKLDADGAIELISRLGSGRAFCCARAATRSTLRSGDQCHAMQETHITTHRTFSGLRERSEGQGDKEL